MPLDMEVDQVERKKNRGGPQCPLGEWGMDGTTNAARVSASAALRAGWHGNTNGHLCGAVACRVRPGLGKAGGV